VGKYSGNPAGFVEPMQSCCAIINPEKPNSASRLVQAKPLKHAMVWQEGANMKGMRSMDIRVKLIVIGVTAMSIPLPVIAGIGLWQAGQVEEIATREAPRLAHENNESPP
jgi:hypothetical protein